MSEEILHRHICDYLKLQHPDVLFRTDFASGMKLTMGQARRHKSLQSGRAWPDLFIAEPRGLYSGLFLELKREGVRVRLKNGAISSDPHIREQYEVLIQLEARGFKAAFAIGFDDARAKIDEYLGTHRRTQDA